MDIVLDHYSNITIPQIDGHSFLEWIKDENRQSYKLIYKAHPVLNVIFYYYDKQIGLVNDSDLLGCIRTNNSQVDIVSPDKGLIKFQFNSKDREYKLTNDIEILTIEYSSEAIKQYFEDIQNIKDSQLKRKKAIELLIKLRELARRGVGGEQKNAERMFYEMLEKYNIQENELD